MKNKKFSVTLIGVILATALIINSLFWALQATHQSLDAQTVAVQSIGSDILAQGSIHSQNEATLHFQTAGKLTFLGVKEGDTVYTGQTIAQLDTFALQRQLTAALNTYRSTRDTFDQNQASAANGNLQGQQKFLADTTTTSKVDGTDVINDTVQRILDQNQASLDNSVINVELANYAIQLATLTSPIAGIVTHEDVTVAGQNITTTTTFAVADPTSLVMRANVAASDIDFVSNGAAVQVHISGRNTPILGSVVKMYPQKQTINGQDVYEVDIASPEIQSLAKLGQTGSVLITSNAQSASVTVPTWTILGHNTIWVEENGKAVRKTVTIGKVHGDQTEITSGLTKNDRIIVNPQKVIHDQYTLL